MQHPPQSIEHVFRNFYVWIKIMFQAVPSNTCDKVFKTAKKLFIFAFVTVANWLRNPSVMISIKKFVTIGPNKIFFTISNVTLIILTNGMQPNLKFLFDSFCDWESTCWNECSQLLILLRRESRHQIALG